MRVQRLTTESEAGAERILRRVIDGTEWMLTIKAPMQTMFAKDNGAPAAHTPAQRSVDELRALVHRLEGAARTR
jgi:hypothetical protein